MFLVKNNYAQQNKTKIQGLEEKTKQKKNIIKMAGSEQIRNKTNNERHKRRQNDKRQKKDSNKGTTKGKTRTKETNEVRQTQEHK